ncbi:hypothetical protein ACQPWW_22910 [Micromonospora sp. CA-240977]
MSTAPCEDILGDGVSSGCLAFGLGLFRGDALVVRRMARFVTGMAAGR